MQCFSFILMACGGDLLCLGFFLITGCLCIQLPRFKALDKLRVNLTLNHGRTQSRELHYGRFLIGQNSSQAAKFKESRAKKNLLEVDADYQADIGTYILNLYTNLHEICLILLMMSLTLDPYACSGKLPFFLICLIL